VARTRRTLWIALLALVGLLLVATGALYARSEAMLRRTYVVPQRPLAIPSDSASVARGAHLVNAVGTCATCHGEDLGGRVYADMGPIGVVAGPNLTPGRGGRGGVFRDEDWVRAIRFGTHRDGTTLIAMPSEVFMNMSDADLGAVVAYLKRLPPVDREMPSSRFRPLGRAHARGRKLNILTAPKTPARSSVPSVPVGVTPPYGKYLVEISGCAGCHGYGLSGGKSGWSTRHSPGLEPHARRASAPGGVRPSESAPRRSEAERHADRSVHAVEDLRRHDRRRDCCDLAVPAKRAAKPFGNK
jgi:cytochrome c553